MDMYPKYKSPLGYSTGDNNIDAYGVDHSGFSNRDEIEYQIAREARENQIIQNYNNQGITENYPQYTTNFWGSSPENNYGFGTSKIHNNIENMQTKTNWVNNSNNTQWGMNNEQSQTYNPLGNSNSTINSGLNNSSLLSPNNMQGLNLDASAALYPQQNSFSTYSQPYQLAQNTNLNTASDVPNQTYIIRENIKFPHDEDLYMPLKSKSIYGPMCINLNNIDTKEPYMQIFNQLGDMVSEFEGGLETNPNKIDQATNMGIKQDTLNNFFAAHPEYKGKYPSKVDDLTREQANTIYCMDFYTQYRIPEIKSKILRESIYDTYVNHSPDEIARWLQEGLNEVTSQHVKVDPEGTVSVMGSETISALNNLTDYEKAKLDEYFLNRREEAWKRENPGYRNKFRGNLNRIQKLRKRHHEAGTY